MVGGANGRKSHWFAVWICLSTGNQSCGASHWVSWSVLIGPPKRAHADVSECMCVLLSWWDRGREGMLMVSLQLNHWVLSGTGTPDKANATKTMCVWGRCAPSSLCDIRTLVLLTLETFRPVSHQRSMNTGPWGGEGRRHVSELVTLIYSTWTTLRLSLSCAFLDQRRWLGFRHPDSVVGGLWKITIYAGHFAKAASCSPPHHTTPLTTGL